MSYAGSVVRDEPRPALSLTYLENRLQSLAKLVEERVGHAKSISDGMHGGSPPEGKGAAGQLAPHRTAALKPSITLSQ